MKLPFLNNLLSSSNLRYTEKPIEFQGRMIQVEVPEPKPVQGSSTSGSQNGGQSNQAIQNTDGDTFIQQAPLQRAENGSQDQNRARPELTASSSETSEANSNSDSDVGPGELTDAEKERVQELRDRDREVRAHEQAHKSAGGSLASAPQYEYTQGPDGRRYAISGSVQIDTQPENEPQETVQKMERVKRAAMAPMEPSPEDRSVYMDASRKQAQARVEMRKAEQEFMTQFQSGGANTANDVNNGQGSESSDSGMTDNEFISSDVTQQNRPVTAAEQTSFIPSAAGSVVNL